MATSEGRVTNVPYDPSVRVDTWWDLGIGDSTSMVYPDGWQGCACDRLSMRIEIRVCRITVRF